MVITHVYLGKGTGLHTLTLLYVNPNNEIVDYCEVGVDLDHMEDEMPVNENLNYDEKNKNNLSNTNLIQNIGKNYVWFIRKLNVNSKDFSYGTWKIILLVDGRYILEEEYKINKNIEFSVHI